MINIAKKILLILVTLNIVGCARYMSSPSIVFGNFSSDYIRDVRGSWNGYSLIGHNGELIPGQYGSENFILKRTSDLFGPVHMEWTNAAGQKIIKDFEFRKEQMPWFVAGKTLNSIEFRLSQNDFKMEIEPKEGFSNEHHKQFGEVARNFKSEFEKTCSKGYGCDLRKH